MTRSLDSVLLVLGWVSVVSGQGRMLDPPGRSSMWRAGFNTPINENDNVLSCGGIMHRWSINKGKCGVCGDPWDSKQRENEAGGKYASNVITKVYKSGSFIKVTIDIAVHNGGHFEFRLCPNNNFFKPVSQSCLDNGLLSTGNGSTRYESIKVGENTVTLKLPDNLVCDQCVLQWKYRTADHMGCDVNEIAKEQKCGFGHGRIQTEYFACADIAINREPQTLGNLQAFSVAKEDSMGTNTTRNKRFVRFPSGSFAVEQNTPNNQQLPYIPLSRGGGQNVETTFVPVLQRRRVQLPWMEPTDARSSSRMRRRVQSTSTPVRGRSFIQQINSFRPTSTSNQGKLSVRRGEFFPGTRPVRALVQVQRPVARQIFANEEGAAFAISAPRFRQQDNTGIQQVFLRQGPTIKSVPVKQCNRCPFDTCLDNHYELDGLFPGLFQDPLKFLECRKYDKLFNLKKFKLVSDGLPECAHPRFKRQLSPMLRDGDDDIGCCATRPQVIMPLTVEADNDTYNVVQLPNDRNQFLVQGLCGQNRTVSCTNCEAENNFQWVLVFDPKTNSVPPVSFVPVKFQHYCRCVNRGIRIFGR